MERPIDRIETERIIPTARFQRDRPRDGGRRFSVSKEDESEDEEDESNEERQTRERAVGPRADDEAGGNLDVTA